MDSDGVKNFPHDTNARRDPKLKILKKEFGPVGYTWYFELIEYLFEQGGRLELNVFTNNILQDEADCDKPSEFIEFATREDVELLSIISVGKKKFLTTEGVQKRHKKIVSRISQLKGAANIRWEKEQEKIAETKKKLDAEMEETIDKIYSAYPKKVDPERSRNYIRKAINAGTDPKMILEKTEAYSTVILPLKKTEKLAGKKNRWRYVPGSAPWFNRQGWLEDTPIIKERNTSNLPATGGKSKYSEAYN